MKRILLIFPLTMILLAACAAPAATAAPGPVESQPTVAPSSTEVVAAPTEPPVMPGRKLPAASFDAKVYVDEQAGFALDYPANWTITTMISERASEVQFLSSPDIADAATLPEGATRFSATLYDWDPKNDLAAYVANRKTAWEASGFTILEEEQLVLEQGLPAVQFTIQTPETTTVFLITALKDRYLVLSGEGDLELVKEMVQRLRPISVK